MYDKKTWMLFLVVVQVLILLFFLVFERWNLQQYYPNNNLGKLNQSDEIQSSTVTYNYLTTRSTEQIKDWNELINEANTKRIKQINVLQKDRPEDCLQNCEKHKELSSKVHHKMLDKSFTIDKRLFTSLQGEESPLSTCDGKLNIYYKSFAILHDVIVKPFKWDMKSLINPGKKLHLFKDLSLRTDNAEVLKPQKGLLELYCPNKLLPIDNTTLDNVLMLKFLRQHTSKTNLDENITENNDGTSNFNYERRFTIAIEREEYANFYHMMLHIHNIFIMLMKFQQQPENLSLLILDSHPEAEVDRTLQTLFGPLVRVADLRKPVKFQHLVLSLPENRSPLSKYTYDILPHLEEFRSFYYNQHMLDVSSSLECAKLKVTFIWRRDKVYHPRNLVGSVFRKIFNEAEIFNALYEKYPNVCFNSILLETIAMKEQLKFIRKTDILIAMHGAGLTHALFLPKTSGVIELFPYKFRARYPYYRLFEAIAKWRKLKYMWWENTNKMMEMPRDYTVIDVEALLRRVDTMMSLMCDNM